MNRIETKPTSTAIRKLMRARLAADYPDGLLLLNSANLSHPEAIRFPELPFLFAIGRLKGPDGRRHTIRELELVDAALNHDRAAVSRYARFVVETAPTQRARLSGRTLLLFRQFEERLAHRRAKREK